MSHAPDIIAILEDNTARVEIMRRAVAVLPRPFDLRHFDSVEGLKSLATSQFARVRLMSLDFDLENSSAHNAGTGMDAVQYLAKRRSPICPVIVHTSSAKDALAMSELLTGNGWTVKRVSFATRDSQEKWQAAVMELMGLRAARR